MCKTWNGDQRRKEFDVDLKKLKADFYYKDLPWADPVIDSQCLVGILLCNYFDFKLEFYLTFLVNHDYIYTYSSSSKKKPLSNFTSIIQHTGSGIIDYS